MSERNLGDVILAVDNISLSFGIMKVHALLNPLFPKLFKLGPNRAAHLSDDPGLRVYVFPSLEDNLLLRVKNTKLSHRRIALYGRLRLRRS